MKKSVLSLFLVAAVALVAAGSAFAEGHQSRGIAIHITISPHVWGKFLREFALDSRSVGPSRADRSAVQPLVVPHRPALHPPAHKPAHASKRKHAQPQHRQQPPRHRYGTTLSLYEQTTKPSLLAEQGCSAARRRDSGVVVLDFGKPAHEHHGYGAILFSGKFAKNHRITTAMVGWARGYVHCLPRNSTAFVTLARGTSNYHPSVPSVRAAGKHWALQTVKFAHILARKGLAGHVASAAADDAEPAWDPRFRKTREFIHGFRRNAKGHMLYDYGSLDGGVGSVWSAKQAFDVAGGIRHTAALPEIYNHAMAQEWAELESIAKNRFHSHVRFAGVMTQGSPHCRCSLRPHAAHHALQRALAAVGVTPTIVPQGGTNIGG